ncbi:hypothetical protein L7F22_055827 [Adiantum nelumboides]|nr:hypothetical protein [Adiantum nelumboides]
METPSASPMDPSYIVLPGVSMQSEPTHGSFSFPDLAQPSLEDLPTATMYMTGGEPSTLVASTTPLHTNVTPMPISVSVHQPYVPVATHPYVASMLPPNPVAYVPQSHYPSPYFSGALPASINTSYPTSAISELTPMSFRPSLSAIPYEVWDPMRAGDWYRTIRVEEKSIYPTLSRLFLKKYIREGVLWGVASQLHKAKREEGESTKDFIIRLKNLNSCCAPNERFNNNQLLDRFIRGLHHENIYNGLIIRVITTWEAVTTNAIELEDILVIAGERVSSDTKPANSQAARHEPMTIKPIVKDIHITVLDVSAKVDFYVMPSKGEGYPLILGRPWLMEVNADQKWGSGKLVLQKGKRIVYDMKLGEQSNICFETSTDEESSDESSYGDEESYTSEESSMEVMGLVFQQSQAKGSSTSKEVEVLAKEEPMMEERLRKMLSKDLTKEEEEDYINMFKRYPHLFITDYSMIKGVDVIQHHIDLKPDAKPVAQKLRRLGVVQQEALLTEVNKLLKAGFIYPVTNSEWVSPVVVTPKKNGKWRVCVDYKPLNAATKRDHFPLPFQDEILNEVAGHERYTICDGYSGYYQIRIAEEDQHKTTFITPWGCFAFRVMPFGLTNAPSTFTKFTSFIFQPFFGKSIRVFLDDFCTYSDRALHCQRVEEGLQRLYQYGGQLNPDKCHVTEKEVVLLGHVISQEGIKVDPSHVQAFLDLPPPNSARQVITFVQKVRYMSRFIHLLSQIISPLQQLANQEVFSWEQEHLECFNEVKEVLGSLPTIMPPDPQGIYYICPSVGLDAFGTVLMQKYPKTAYMRPIYFTSKVMTQGQKGYTDIEQLVFSLIVAIRKFRSYLLPKPFIILTLEHNLPYAMQHMSISSKISKWVLELQEHEYTFIVEDSTRASLADVLTYKVKENKITPKAQVKLDLSPQGELEDAYTLLFDGAYHKQRNKADGGFVILNEEKKEVLKKSIQLHLAHSNNEAEYATLKAGLEECKSMEIRRLMVKGDALLIVRQVQGTWACKNSKLLQWLHEVKLLMKDFEAIQIQHISRQHNKEADNMANSQFEVMVGAIKFKEPL